MASSTGSNGDDLNAVVEGIKFVRNMTGGMRDVIDCEELPGPGCDSDEQLKTFVRDHAWGHHASGTCAIGPPPNGVLSSDFRVHGVERLRVVDASIFPRIPGLFIVSAIYMIAEKAAEVVARDSLGQKVIRRKFVRSG